MKVLLIHDHYRSSAPSGEDVVFENERKLLERHGTTVVVYERHNDDIEEAGLGQRIRLAANTVWSLESYRQIQTIIRQTQPDIAHFHNTFPLISPAAYWACRSEGVPVVQTLHNYRLFCVAGLFLRDGKPCEDCITDNISHALRHKCYRSSFPATSVMVATLQVHRLISTFQKKVNRYIALTQFAARKCAEAGLPAERIVVKPNFLPNPPEVGTGDGEYVAFVGRIAEEKGLRTLIRAWNRQENVRLRVAGDGPLRAEMENYCRENSLNVEFLGRLSANEIITFVRNAAVVVVPSEWYEGFPMVIVEAFACGTPVVAADIGGLPELAIPHRTGATFVPSNSDDLKRVITDLLSNRSNLAKLRVTTRQYFDEYLTERTNYEQLMAIYHATIAESGGKGCRGADVGDYRNDI